MRHKKNVRPEPERLIRCYGSDWSDFVVVGKFVPFKPGAKHKNGRTMSEAEKKQGRFFERDKHGNFYVARETWKDVTEWEYV